MTPHERDLIVGLAQRLREAGPPHKDEAAERLILDEIALRPDALYQLTQTVVALELALQQAEARIDHKERARSGLLRGWFGSRDAAPPGASDDGAGRFLRTAATTAAGVAGGWLVADGLRPLIDHESDVAVAAPCHEPSPQPVAITELDEDEFPSGYGDADPDLGAGD
jgi:hypothetical protein